jgi:hypothetical protein
MEIEVMPADPERIGSGVKRQGDTEPERQDSRNEGQERQYREEQSHALAEADHERRRQPGAHGARTPQDTAKPGTRSALQDAEDTVQRG